MIDRTTLLADPANLKAAHRQFRFDYSYWSHDGYTVSENGYYEPVSDKYISQELLFDALGVGLLDNAWSGYNCTIFAYGQTGSGKSYSMMGYEPNKGIVPMLGEKLFQGIVQKRSSNVIFKVSVSMLEIYNEKVQDLLISKTNQPQQSLAVRMSPKHGFFEKSGLWSNTGAQAPLVIWSCPLINGVKCRVQVVLNERRYIYIAASSVTIRTFLEFLLTVLCIIFFPSHWLLSHINIVQTKDTIEKGMNPVAMTVIDFQARDLLFQLSYGLSDCHSCTDITYYIEQGTKNRTLAATKMNETSSRAHTIVIISFMQNFIKENKSKQSKIYMVDLAGSERAAQTGATGARFHESKNINKSLMTLGTVIKNLCAIACERNDQGPTPYRDSKLTMLLKDAIGGNCKTIMVATLSPSEEDYKQTLSTLRYADRVKSIKNVAIKNVEATDKLIKELLAEKQALLCKLKSLPHASMGYTEQDLKKLKDEQAHEIELLKNEMQNVEAAWEKRLQEAKKQMEKQQEYERKLEKDRKCIPHLWNLNEDPTLSQKIFHFIKNGETVNVGNRRSSLPVQIELHGPSIAKHHAIIHNRLGELSIHPVQGTVKVNGRPIKQQTSLRHQDRIFFGASNLFVLHIPMKGRDLDPSNKHKKTVTYEMAQAEIAKYLEDIKTNGIDWLKQEIAEILLLTQESNAMAREMEKGITFEPLVLAKQYSNDTKRTKVYILVRTGNGGEFLWGRDHFLDRYDLMTDMYQKFVDGISSWQPNSPTQDPFWEPLETPTLIGLAYVPLESIAYMLDIDEQKIGIYDYQAGHAGYLTVVLVPCTEVGDECLEEKAVEDPTELLGQEITFKVKIKGATGIPKRYKTSWCHYTFYNEEQRHYTDEKMGAVPKYNYEKLHTVKEVGSEEIEYLENNAIVIEVYGRQGSSYDQRRGSSLNAYTMSDRRRLSHNLAASSTSTILGRTSDSSMLMTSMLDSASLAEHTSDDQYETTVENDYKNPDQNKEEIGDMIQEIFQNMSETAETRHTSGVLDSKGIIKTDPPDRATNTFSEMQRGISGMIDEIVQRNEIAVDPDHVEEMLGLSSNTTVQILKDVLESTKKDLKETENALSTSKQKIGIIDKVIFDREDSLANEIKKILKD